MLTSEQQRTYVGHCGACRSTLRPDLIPWSQHSLGCVVRERELSTMVDRWQAQLERIRALPELAGLPDCGPRDPMRAFVAWRERPVSPSRKS